MILPSGGDALTPTSGPFLFIPIQFPSSPHPVGAISQTQLPRSQTSDPVDDPRLLFHKRLGSAHTAAGLTRPKNAKDQDMQDKRRLGS